MKFQSQDPGFGVFGVSGVRFRGFCFFFKGAVGLSLGVGVQDLRI